MSLCQIHQAFRGTVLYVFQANSAILWNNQVILLTSVTVEMLQVTNMTNEI